jgi:glycerol-3-phosphate dehydrogenase (NAD(P)+)
MGSPEKRVVAVIGGGAWGLALALAAARAGSQTLLFTRRAQRIALPTNLTLASGFDEIGRRARLIVLAVPSATASSVVSDLGDFIDGRHFVVHGIRGLDRGDAPRAPGAADALRPISEIIRADSPARRIGALGGPALASDLRDGRPSVLVAGSAYPEVSAALCTAFVSETLRMYTTNDILGLEWASALVGCLAIGVGYAKGVGLGAGLIAAFISRGVQEAGRIAASAGGNDRTLLGLAGYGDLLASAEQQDRPEVKLGTALAKGETLDRALAAAALRVEAVDLIPRVVTFAESRGVRAPIFRALANDVLTGRPKDSIVRDLMTGPVEDQG